MLPFCSHKTGLSSRPVFIPTHDYDYANLLYRPSYIGSTNRWNSPKPDLHLDRPPSAFFPVLFSWAPSPDYPSLPPSTNRQHLCSAADTLRSSAGRLSFSSSFFPQQRTPLERVSIAAASPRDNTAPYSRPALFSSPFAGHRDLPPLHT
ncbi:hypothetical protein BHE90_008103 [Fusarium euwallaceae]|uniref:Uncharacterized protein n=1 Tax=Fusarium euwallaceae TaxID=1147111 RepID=A0A430LNX6_9HYPO|nr:hypothetical protein BHE90_008103 [Fusarium euwallaceae]